MIAVARPGRRDEPAKPTVFSEPAETLFGMRTAQLAAKSPGPTPPVLDEHTQDGGCFHALPGVLGVWVSGHSAPTLKSWLSKHSQQTSGILWPDRPLV